MSEQFPYSFGKYRMEAEIGRGGFGTVYRAEDIELGRSVAIKVLYPLYMRDQRWVARFRSEARMMAGLDHPHIVPIYDIGEVEGRLYLAMKYVHGPDLEQLITDKGRLTWDRVVELVGQVSSALDYAHQRNIIHRDIKPANILISDGQAMLTDFGLAQMLAGSKLSESISKGVVGTYNYISPEVFNEEAVTPASDVYALGCVVYEMLTGNKLVGVTTPAAVMRAHVNGVTLDEPLPAGTPPNTREILATALAKDPNERYALAGELAQELQCLTDDKPIKTPTVDKAGLPGWVWWTGALVGFIFLVLGIRAIYFAAGYGKPETIWVTPIVTETNAGVDVLPTATDEPKRPPLNSVVGAVWQRPKDKMNTVYVPEGSFMMGSEDSHGNEQPVHKVTLDGFRIDQNEVSNAQFEKFVAETSHETTAEKIGSGRIIVGNSWEEVKGAEWRHPQGPGSDLTGLENHPVVLVSWEDANAYCTWAGGMLPYEAQWEFAARGPQGLIYPWGEEFDGQKVNYCDQNCLFSEADESVDDGFPETAPVGSYEDGASWVGALNMAGNVWEWVDDWYGRSYYVNSPLINPQGPEDSKLKILRGGSWDNFPAYLRGANRLSRVPDLRNNNIGFRCASPAEFPSLGFTGQRDQDDMKMVYVPAGSFVMGTEDGSGDEEPEHDVTLTGFWIDQTEVTNSQYARFLIEWTNQKEGGVEWLKMDGAQIEVDGDFAAKPEYSEHPVINVSWYGAAAYCEWVDGQLPSEAQWEYAARGPESKLFPWGNEDPTCNLAQFGDCGGQTVPVGSFIDGASWVGALDMAGNVREWVNDRYLGVYYANSPQNNPQGPEDGEWWVLRGGSWADNWFNLRGANRSSNNPDGSGDGIGFRCSLSSE